MIKKTSYGTLIVLTVLLVSLTAGTVKAQNIGASLSDLEGRAGRQVVVDLELFGNNVAAQTAINMIYNPNVINIEDVTIDVNPGPLLDENQFFIIKGVKSTAVQDPVNSEGLFYGIFAGTFPPVVIPNGVIASIIFRISPDAAPGDFSDIKFSFLNVVPANATSFAAQDGSFVPFDQANFIDGRITVVSRSNGSCALAQGDVTTNSLLIGVLLILLIPLSIVGLRRLWKKNYGL